MGELDNNTSHSKKDHLRSPWLLATTFAGVIAVYLWQSLNQDSFPRAIQEGDSAFRLETITVSQPNVFRTGAEWRRMLQEKLPAKLGFPAGPKFHAFHASAQSDRLVLWFRNEMASVYNIRIMGAAGQVYSDHNRTIPLSLP